MEENYGKKIGEAKTLPLAVSGMLMVAFIFLIAGISVMGYGISKGKFGSLGTTGIVLFLVGQIFGVTRERIRQIENKAIRKLRHPSRAKKIKDFYC